MNSSSNKLRVQDAELQKMSDPGKCLSMHQPYVSYYSCFFSWNFFFKECLLIFIGFLIGKWDKKVSLYFFKFDFRFYLIYSFEFHLFTNI